MKKIIILALAVLCIGCGDKEPMPGKDLMGVWVAPDISDEVLPDIISAIGSKKIHFDRNAFTMLPDPPNDEFKPVRGSPREAWVEFWAGGGHGWSAYYIPEDGILQVAKDSYFNQDDYVHEYTYWFNGDALHFRYMRVLKEDFPDADVPGTEYVYYRSE